MATKTDPLTLEQRLQQARSEVQRLAGQLAATEGDMHTALGDKRYADADRFKHDADLLREPLLIAQAHAQALEVGMAELARHREEEQRLQRERETREQALVGYQAATEAKTEAIEEMQQHLADLQPAYTALRQVIKDAMAAEARYVWAMQEEHRHGLAAGTVHPGHPAPTNGHWIAARLERNPVLSVIWRTEQLPT